MRRVTLNPLEQAAAISWPHLPPSDQAAELWCLGQSVAAADLQCAGGQQDDAGQEVSRRICLISQVCITSSFNGRSNGSRNQAQPELYLALICGGARQ